MVKRVLLIALVLMLVLVAGVLVSGQDEVGAACSGNDCLDCLAFQCVGTPTSGHCTCFSEGEVGGPRSCVAGGGVCIPKE